ncbi:MAG TPA: sugar dehydrogenase [Acidimicrobiaceae bacterium]|nr:sugar dehydrogenase [Acidimicrobiaceae bacterium]
MSRRIAIAGLCSLAIIAAACTDDAGSDTSATTASSPAAPGTDTPSTSDTGLPDTVPSDTVPSDTVPSDTVFEPGPTGTPTANGVTYQQVVSGIERPVDIAWRVGDDTAYVVSQVGVVHPLRDGALGDPVLDISGRITNEGEQGLLGLRFSLDGSLAYVNYTDGSGDTVIAAFAVGDDGSFTDEQVILTIAQPYGNHNGGALLVGPDGYLYIATGDGGAANDPERAALDLSSLLGKVLRIEPTPGEADPYAVPADNPYVGVDGARPEIWAIGLRNPWRFSFDSATGDMWIGDVGQGDWEEVSAARATDGTDAGRGVNFGWSAWEGTHRFNDDQVADDVLMPVYEYSHGNGDCSVSGGAVYRGNEVPDLRGWYLFADWCSGLVWAIPSDVAAGDPGSVTVVELGRLPNVSAIVAAPNDELYVLAHGDGSVYRLIAA